MAKEPEYMEVRKITSFGGANQRRAKTVEIMLKEDLVEEVIEVKGLDDIRMMKKMMCERKILHVVSL